MAKALTNEGLLQKIQTAIENVKNMKLDRKDLNAEIASERAALEALGIPKKAFDMAMSYMNMDPDDREGFDVAYALVRQAGGLPMQEDLFSAADRKAAEPVGTEGPKGPDAGEIAKVIESQENEKTKGKTVLPSSAGEGTIN